MAGDKRTLKDWCSEACYNFLTHRIDEREAKGLKFDSKVLDIRNAELLMAKIMDDNPVLIMSFMAQQLNCVRDASGAIVEGGEVGGGGKRERERGGGRKQKEKIKEKTKKGAMTTLKKGRGKAEAGNPFSKLRRERERERERRERGSE